MRAWPVLVLLLVPLAAAAPDEVAVADPTRAEAPELTVEQGLCDNEDPTVHVGVGTSQRCQDPTETCNNYGIVAQVGLANRYECVGECTNYGVHVAVGPNHTHCTEGCENEGLMVLVLAYYCNQGGVAVCYGDECLGACWRPLEGQRVSDGVEMDDSNCGAWNES